MKAFIRLITAFALACCLSCGKNNGAGIDTPSFELPLSITKAGENSDGMTVSAYLFNTDDVRDLKDGTEGTYYIDGTSLIPCSIDGEDIEEDHGKGLRVNQNTQYIFSLASPAESLTEIGETGYFGIPYSREQAVGKEKRFIFINEYLYFAGFYLDKTYSYNVGSFKEKRSKIRVKISCSEELPEGFELRSVTLTDVLKSSWYLPQKGNFYHSDASDNFEEPITLAFPDVEFPVKLNPGESISSATTGEPYIISQDYSALDENQNPLYVMPRLNLIIRETEISIPLNYDFGSQEILTFTINVKSSIAGISLGISDWTSVPASAAEFDRQPETEDTITTDPWDSTSDSCDIGE